MTARVMAALGGLALLVWLAAPGEASAQNQGDVAVDLPVATGTVTVTDSLPDSGRDPASFRAKRFLAVDGQVRLHVGSTPVYVEEGPSPAYRALSPSRRIFGAHPAAVKGEADPFALARDLGLGWHRGFPCYWVDIQDEEDIKSHTFRFETLDQDLASLPRDMEVLVNISLPERIAGDRQRPRPGRGAGVGPPPGGGGMDGGPRGPGGPPPWAHGNGAPPWAEGGRQWPPPWGQGGQPPAPPWGGGGAGPGFGPPPGQMGAEGAGTRWQLKQPESDYRDFLDAVIQRYGSSGRGLAPRVRHWQFENEPDMQRGSGDPQGFARLHEITYRAIKQNDPQAMVLMAGMSGKGDLESFRFYEQAISHLSGPYLDAFDIHFYGPSSQWWRMAPLYRHVRDFLDGRGLSRTQIWMTEVGTYSGQPMGAPLPYQSPEAQAQGLVKFLALARALGAEKIFWAFGIMEGFHNTQSIFDLTGLVYDGVGPGDPGRGIVKPAYHSYKMLVGKLSGPLRFLGRLDLGPRVMCLVFQRGDKLLQVLWSEEQPIPQAALHALPLAGGAAPVGRPDREGE